MPKYSSNRFVTQTLVFSALNVFLCSRHGDAVPTSYLLVCAAGLIGCLVAVKLNQIKFALEKTKRFRILFSMLTLSEVFFTILVPWLFILVDSNNNGYLVAPHLFALQAQIALEGIFIRTEGHSMLVYYFSILANLFRGLALLTWTTRTKAVDEVVGLGWSIKMLPRIAACLWIFSNLFIVFEWYPCIQRMEMTSPSKMKER